MQTNEYAEDPLTIHLVGSCKKDLGVFRQYAASVIEPLERKVAKHFNELEYLKRVKEVGENLSRGSSGSMSRKKGVLDTSI